MALVQSKNATAVDASSITATFANPTTAGNALIGVCYVRQEGADPPITIPTGWAEAVKTATTATLQGPKVVIAYKENATSVSSVTFDFGSNLLNAVLHVFEHSGMVTSGLLDKAAAQPGDSTTPNSGTTADPTVQANEVAIGAVCNRVPAETHSNPTAGYTLRHEDTASTSTNGIRAGTYDRTLSATGTQSFGLTLSGTRPWVAAVATFKTAPSGSVANAGNIASAEAHGTASVGATATPTGIASAQAFGNPVVQAAISPTGIASAEAFGATAVQGGVSPTGIASAEAFGTPNAQAGVAPAGIASAEAHGATSIGAHVSPSGIPTAEASGQPTLDAQIAPTGVPSAESFGTPSISEGIRATGIPSGEAVATPAVGAQIGASGIQTQEAFGSPSLDAPVFPASISSSEAFGALTVGDVTQIKKPTGGHARIVYHRRRARPEPVNDDEEILLILECWLKTRRAA